MVAPTWADSAFDGIGASRTGGRWNSKGVRIVYLGGSLALAALELLAHIDYERALREHMAIPVDFDESQLLSLEQDRLPENWQTVEGLEYTQATGDAWIKQSASALLAVPSRVVSVEHNYLLNPQHVDAKLVRIGAPQLFRYDSRLLKR